MTAQHKRFWERLSQVSLFECHDRHSRYYDSDPDKQAHKALGEITPATLEGKGLDEIERHLDAVEYNQLEWGLSRREAAAYRREYASRTLAWRIWVYVEGIEKELLDEAGELTTRTQNAIGAVRRLQRRLERKGSALPRKSRRKKAPVDSAQGDCLRAPPGGVYIPATRYEKSDEAQIRKAIAAICNALERRLETCHVLNNDLALAWRLTPPGGKGGTEAWVLIEGGDFVGCSDNEFWLVAQNVATRAGVRRFYRLPGARTAQYLYRPADWELPPGKEIGAMTAIRREFTRALLTKEK